jgi:sulfate adenylyltransferase subunit 2
MLLLWDLSGPSAFGPHPQLALDKPCNSRTTEGPGLTPGLLYLYMSTTAVSEPHVTVTPRLDHLRALEAESIHILREVVAEFERPVMLYSIGKDSSVMLRLAQKAFHPGPIPFPLLHVDTTYKFDEMIRFRDQMAASVGARLIVHTNEEAISDGTQPFKVGTQRCCGLLKTKSLLDALQTGNFDAALGGARRDEERSRAKERVFSLRDANGQWDPKRQRPELWNLLNGRLGPGESIRIFPLSNWTEIDVWQYIHAEDIPIVPLYYAKEREVLVRGNSLIVQEQPFVVAMPGEKPQMVKCRMRSLGCSPCTGAIRSDADTVPKIIEELISTRQSERQLRIIDHDQDGSMEMKKREGYF